MSGCLAVTPPSEDPVLIKLEELDRRLQAIERVVQNQSLVTMTQQLSALERRVDELQGTAEEIQYNASTTYERQRELYADLDARIQGLESTLQARGNVNVLDGGPLPPGQLPVPGGSDRDNYQAAFELLKEQRYEPAALAFQQFLKTYPDSELADNAQYWLAESYYVAENGLLQLRTGALGRGARRLVEGTGGLSRNDRRETCWPATGPNGVGRRLKRTALVIWRLFGIMRGRTARARVSETPGV
jgi:tetratricopeptide (TPR) repeat protein